MQHELRRFAASLNTKDGVAALKSRSDLEANALIPLGNTCLLAEACGGALKIFFGNIIPAPLLLKENSAKAQDLPQQLSRPCFTLQHPATQELSLETKGGPASCFAAVIYKKRQIEEQKHDQSLFP